ncbi:ComF family protein [Snuella lapsa]|uniref:ComF family protein n=1 Tax=Snuella lapsa TaxID=870481 RepID=A0ABP6XNX7_9FLAO
MFKSLVNLFFPKVCYACLNLLQDNEETVCVDCRHNLPVTNYHFNNDNSVLKVFYGRVKVENATALLRFEKKGIVQQLIHGLKYRGYESVGVFLGQWLGNELKTIQAYSTVEMVIPVPLHKNKLKKRGYNQVAKFGQHIAAVLNCNYNDEVLVKITNMKSQVNKKRFARWQNNETLFALQTPETIENKHILLIDDIITTGATLEACINVLNQAQNVKISVATMAIA